MLTAQAVADCLRVSPAFVRGLVKKGDLYWEPGRGEVVSEEQLDRYIDSCRADTAVYFIRMKESGHIKIGIARDPQLRLEALKTGNPEPLELIAFTVVVDGRALERQLHSRLANYRLKGEWFRDGEWANALRALLAKGGPGLSEGKVRKALLA